MKIKGKKVFSGIIFDIYQWPQKMFDGSTATFESAVRQNTVVIIPTVKNKIVILRQKQPGMNWFYDLPSGRMDKKAETPKQAALRELLEETGMRPKNIRLWKTYSPSGKVRQKVFFFVANDCKKIAQQKLDPGEKITYQLLNFDEFLKLTDHKRCFLGPLMIDALLARIHKENYYYLKKSIFQKPIFASPKYGPRTNW